MVAVKWEESRRETESLTHLTLLYVLPKHLVNLYTLYESSIRSPAYIFYASLGPHPGTAAGRSFLRLDLTLLSQYDHRKTEMSVETPRHYNSGSTVGTVKAFIS